MSSSSPDDPAKGMEVQQGQGSESGMEVSVTNRVPSLSSLCFPSVQTLSLRPIDLSTPLPVTRLGASPSSPGEGNGQNESHDEHFYTSQAGKHLLSACLKSKRLKRRKEIFYKMGLLNHWEEEKRLMGAVQGSDVTRVSELLEQGLNPNVSDDKKRTPLHVAASQGLHQVVRLLLAKKADPTLQDILGNTPLHLAVCRGDLDSVKVLIENGANIFMRDNSGRTPLSLVRNRLGGLRRNKTSSTDAFKSEFILMSEILCSSAARHNNPDDFVSSMDALCNQMQIVSTRERADEITDAAIQHMSITVCNKSLSHIPLL